MLLNKNHNPTDESFIQNLNQSHSQIAVWKCSLNADHPTVDVYLYGWGKEGENKYFIPLLVAPGVCLVPEEIMKVFRCVCDLENSCKSGNWFCNNFRLICSTFWQCEGISCTNPLRRNMWVKSNLINLLSLKYIF